MPTSDECLKYLESSDWESAIDCLSQVIELDPNNTWAFFNRGAANFNLHCYEKAIEDFDRAIELDPILSSFFYNRGVAKAILHNYEKAIEDFDRAIELDPNGVTAFISRGNAKVELHHYEKAIEDFDRAIELDPNGVTAFISRGNANEKLYRYEKAIQDYDRAIELNPTFTIAINNRGFTNLQLHRYEKAIEDFDRAIELNPNFTLAIINRGVANFHLQLYEKAIEDFDRAIELNPNDAKIIQNRGVSNYKLNRYEKAIQDYDRAIGLDPNDASAFHNRGVAKAKLLRYEKAIEDYDLAIELNLNFTIAFYNRGLAKADLHRYEKAIEDFDCAIELDPNIVQTFLKRGLAKANLQCYEKSIEDFDRAIELDPNDASAFYNRGISNYHLHRYEKAIQDYDCAIQLDPSNANVFYNRGAAKAKLHRYEKAIQDYDHAIELDPRKVNAFYSRGLANYYLHRYEKAIQDCTRAIELDPNDASAFYNRGVANFQLHRYEKAIQDYDCAIQLDPSNANVFYNRGAAKAKLHRYEKAIQDFGCAIELNPELSIAYSGKAHNLLIGFNELNTAHYHYNRFLILAKPEEIIENWKTIHDFYTRHTTSPLLLHRLFALLPGIGDFVSWQGSLYETERQCRILKSYLQHLRHIGEQERDAPQFHRLEGLVQYFMGDPMEAYRIYDETLDGEMACLDLMDNYYFLLSAAQFLEPSEGIRHFALQQAKAFLEIAQIAGNERELYYAGQLHAVSEDWETAFEAFERAEAFFPAAVMLAVAAERLGKPQAEVEVLWGKAKQLAEVQPPEAGINGFPEVWLELGREDYLAPFRQYAHHREIAEHLHRFREEDAPFHVAEFWEIWRLSPADEAEIEWQVRKRELESIEAELQSFFTQNLAQQYAGYTEEQLANLELVLAKKNKAAQAIFEKLKPEAAFGSEALEHQLGLEIDHWELRSAHAYALMLKYFFLSGKLEDKPALLLYFYNDATAAKRQRDYSAAKEAYVEGSQPVFSLLVNTLLKLGDVASAVAAGALSVLTLQFFNQNQAPLDEDDPMSNYQKFKAAFLKFLSFEMESMGREKFFDKYPLQGWEDWKK